MQQSLQIKDLADIKGGKRLPKGTLYSDTKTKHPYLRVCDFQNRSINTNELKYISEITHEKISRYTISEDDIYISIAGTIGLVGSIPKYLNGANLTENAAKIVINKPSLITRDYLIWYLQTAGQTAIANQTKSTSQPKLALFRIGELTIPLPPLSEQKRIAAILDKADAIRRKRQQAIELANEFLRSVFLDMFGDPVVNPKGWEVKPITEIASIITGYAFKSKEYIDPSDQSVRLCRGINTLTGYFSWKDTAYWPKSDITGLEDFLLAQGDVILALDRPWISSGLKVCIWEKNQDDTYLVQRVARLRPIEPIYTDFIYACIKSQTFQQHCCPTETTVPHISPVELRSFSIPLPKKELIEKFHRIVSAVHSSKNKLANSELSANEFYQSLSQNAFAGKL